MQPGLDPLAESRASLEAMAARLDLHPLGTLRPPAAGLTDLRRGRRPGARRGVGVLTLVERQGMLVWEMGTSAPAARRNVGRFRRGPAVYGTPVFQREFTPLEPNEITGYMEKLDGELTPERGIRQWNHVEAKLEAAPQVATAGKILLFVHGTFSNSQQLFDEMLLAPAGRGFLDRAAAAYTQVLAFDHPTVSVSPMINAIDLRNALAPSGAAVDIVCHSRGGLVSRWWMEAADERPLRPKRAVFVASPLGGTSLASPPRLRNGLNLLASLSRLLGNAAMAVPYMSAPAAILRVFGSVVGLSANIPLVDAGVAMIPGLNGQSRVGNNNELLRLNRNAVNTRAGYFYVRSNFQSEDPKWRIWKYATEAKLRAAEALSDMLVFPSDNDLVVDTVSMTEPGQAPTAGPAVLDFGTNGEVYHTNYFRQQKTLDFIATSLGIP